MQAKGLGKGGVNSLGHEGPGRDDSSEHNREDDDQWWMGGMYLLTRDSCPSVSSVAEAPDRAEKVTSVGPGPRSSRSGEGEEGCEVSIVGSGRRGCDARSIRSVHQHDVLRNPCACARGGCPGRGSASRLMMGANPKQPEALPWQVTKSGLRAPHHRAPQKEAVIPTSNRYSGLADCEDDFPLLGALSVPTIERVGPTGHERYKPKSAMKERRKARKWTRAPFTGCLLQETSAKAPLQLCEVTYRGKRLVEAAVDSGAEASVSHPKHFPGKLLPSPMSIAGECYKAANASEIKNLGQKDVTFGTDEGHLWGIQMQCANVAQPLIAASQLASAGNEIVLSKSHGLIKNFKTGKTTRLHRRGGLYILRMWVDEDPDDADKSSKPVFAGRR